MDKLLSESESFLSHDIIEVLSGDLPAIGSSPLQHLLKLMYVHGFSQFLSHSFHVVNIDGSRLVVVEQVEDLANAVLF